jgi:multiple sugar transport system substrate-binding protein
LILIGTFLNRLAGFGGDFFDNLGKPTIHSPEAVAALEHLIAELPYALPSPATVAFDEMLGPWTAGKVGMVEFWADLGKISDAPGQAITRQWGVCPLPKGPAPKGKTAAPLNAGWSLGISPKSRQTELALQFLSFCIRPDIVLRICTIQGGLDPARWSTYNLPAFRECVGEELASAAESAIRSAAVAWPTNGNWPQLQAILHENLYLAVCGNRSPQKALQDTQSAWSEHLEASNQINRRLM